MCCNLSKIDACFSMGLVNGLRDTKFQFIVWTDKILSFSNQRRSRVWLGSLVSLHSQGNMWPASPCPNICVPLSCGHRRGQVCFFTFRYRMNVSHPLQFWNLIHDMIRLSYTWIGNCWNPCVIPRTWYHDTLIMISALKIQLNTSRLEYCICMRMD